MGPTDMEILKGVKPGDEIVTGSFSVLRTLKNNTKVKVDNSATKPPEPGGLSGTRANLEQLANCTSQE